MKLEESQHPSQTRIDSSTCVYCVQAISISCLNSQENHCLIFNSRFVSPLTLFWMREDKIQVISPSGYSMLFFPVVGCSTGFKYYDGSFIVRQQLIFLKSIRYGYFNTIVCSDSIQLIFTSVILA